MATPATGRTRTKVSEAGGHVPGGPLMWNYSAGVYAGSPIFGRTKANCKMSDEIGGTWPKKPGVRFRPLAVDLDQSAPWYTSYQVHRPKVFLMPEIHESERRVYAVMDKGAEEAAHQPRWWTEGYQYNLTPPSRVANGYFDDVVGDYLRARYDAWLAVLHAMPAAQQNVVRAVCELKDTKKMSQEAWHFIGWIRFYSKLPKALRQRYGIGKYTPVYVMAKAYLTWKFGVEPTVKELKTFRDEVTQGSYGLSGPKDRGRKVGEVDRRGFRTRLKYPQGYQWQATDPFFTLDTTPSRSTSFGPCGEYGGYNPDAIGPDGLPEFVPFTWVTDLGRIPTSFSSYMPTHYEYQYRGVIYAQHTQKVEWTGLEALVSRFHWNNPLAATAWELMPASFVVNWWIDLTEVLKRIERTVMYGISSSTLSEPQHCTRLVRNVSVPRVVDQSYYELYHHSWKLFKVKAGHKLLSPGYWQLERVGLKLRTRFARAAGCNFYPGDKSMTETVRRGLYKPEYDSSDPVVWMPRLKLQVKAYQLQSLVAMQILNGSAGK